jgi:hypothetical protein
MFVKFNKSFSLKIALGGSFLLGLIVSSFKNNDDIHLLAIQTQLKLNTFHDEEHELIKAKKYEILVTDDGFLRYRKTFSTNKQEYYSLNLRRLSAVNYWGNTTYGDLLLKTLSDDVIAQTYNDPRGNIDSMTNTLHLNLKSIEPEDLDIIQNNLMKISTMLKK